MGNIHLLDELTINKIAAGEVIERPASVIKEMVENSIDANATSITVEIKNGGISYIKIIDNGKGIAQDDLEMAFERHATSKIRSAEDLDTVASMGFRGEALASIAAISNVELISKTEAQQTGYKVVLEGGSVLNKEEIGCQTGTTITVQNLFFNTPVRYKFLKKDFTEAGYIEDVITRIALVNPQIAFKLINTGKTIIQTSGNGVIKDAIYSIYGRDVAEQILNVDYTFDDMKITGVIGKPQIARSNRSNQLFFVNKRNIKDKVLTAATEQAYKGMIDPGKYGFVVLNIEMPQTKVDVNVHPAKLEVRFAEENKVFQAIFHAIKDSLLKDYSSKEVSTPVDNIIIQTRETSYEENNKAQAYNSFNSFSNGVINNYNGNNSFNDEKKDIYNKEENRKDDFEQEEKNEKDERPRGLGFFSWKRNKNLFGEQNNIVEDLYNQKRESEFSSMLNSNDNQVANTNQEVINNEKQDDIVNTSDVLKELKQINEHVQNEIKEEEIRKENTAKLNIAEISAVALNNNVENVNVAANATENKEVINSVEKAVTENEINKTENVEEKNLPDGTTYTYVGENKEKIEELLRQLHPELNNKTDDIVETYEMVEKENNSISETEANTVVTDRAEIVATDVVTDMVEINNAETAIETVPSGEIATVNESQNSIAETIKPEVPAEIEKNETGLKVAEETQNYSYNEVKQETPKTNTSSNFNQMYEKLFGTPVKEEISEEQKREQEKFNAVDIIKDNVSVFEGIPSLERPTYKLIGDVFGEFIIVEIDKEMYIVNKTTAKEKVIFEKLKYDYYNQTNKESQMLLLPDIIELNNKQIEIINENLNLLLKTGFSFEEFGENTLRLMGVPTGCMELDTKELFLKVLENINTVPITAIQEKEEKIIGTIAHELTIKHNEIDTQEDINNLMDDLLQLKEPFKLDIEKPIAIKMSKYDIERKFSRK